MEFESISPQQKKERCDVMKLKRFLCLILALSLVFCLFGCEQPDRQDRTEEKEPAESTITPLLYKVTDSEGHTIWLFGSIHVGYDYFFPLPDYVYDAYESADAIAFEFDIKAFEKDTGAMVDALSVLVYTDGSTIKDHIDPALYTAAVDLLSKYGYYNKNLDYYKPILWSSFLDNCFTDEMGLDADLGIDNHFLDMAYEDEKEILEIESPEFQYGMMANFSPPLQEELLAGSVETFSDLDASREDMQTLVDLWSTGDETAFAAYLVETPEFESEEERKLYEDYNTAMVVERNISMTDFAEDALRSGKEVFICVGAAHIVGPGAMADLLAQRGYTVEIVRAT